VAAAEEVKIMSRGGNFSFGGLRRPRRRRQRALARFLSTPPAAHARSASSSPSSSSGGPRTHAPIRPDFTSSSTLSR